MDKLWASQIFGRTTKVKMYSSNVKAVLLYASESLTVTQRTVDRIQVFINKCPRRILNLARQDNQQGTVEENE